MYAVGIVAAVVFGAIGYRQGQRKNRAIEGLILGALIGLIGLLILHFLKPKQEAAAAQTWGAGPAYGVAAPNAYAQQAGYGQANVLPGGANPAGAAVPANPYAPIAETAGYGYDQPVPVAQPAQAPQPAPAAPAVAAQWFADPSGRHQHRYWDGSTWTEHVADNGAVSVDAPLPAQPF